MNKQPKFPLTNWIFHYLSTFAGNLKTDSGYLKYVKEAFKESPESKNSSIVLALASFSIFVFLLLRSFGLYPLVFCDEYYHSLASRLLAFTDSPYSNYLYLAIYRFTNLCGDGFLYGARVLNSLFFVAATPFVYLTARQFCTDRAASIVAFLTILGPINTYTGYYMPEALYFCSFWIFTWFILGLDNRSNLKLWCIAGVLLGLSALIKCRVLLILPAIITYILYISRKTTGYWNLDALRNVNACVSFTLLTKFLVGYLFAGKSGINLGFSIGTTVESFATHSQSIIYALVLLSKNFKGHVLAICLLFSLPFASAIYLTFNSIVSKSALKREQCISFYALVVLFNLIFITSFFTAIFGATGVTRLSMRYYNFALPLWFIITASQLSFRPTHNTFKWRSIVAFPIGIASLYAIYTYMLPYAPNSVDAPELRGFLINPKLFYTLSGISLFSLALWSYIPHIGAKLFFYLFMPLTVVSSTFYVNKDIWILKHIPDVYDKAGIIARKYLSNDELSNLVVVSSDISGLYRTLFYIDNAKAYFQLIPKDTAYDLSSLADKKKWVLLIGDYTLPKDIFFQIPLNGFTLAHVKKNISMDFRKSEWPNVILRTQGLYPAESWGTWSTKTVTLEFVNPLPEKFNLYLLANTLGQNVGKEFIAYVGDYSIKFTLSGSPEERVLTLVNPGKMKLIRIEAPTLISPKELGINDDARTLGIALKKLSIVPL